MSGGDEKLDALVKHATRQTDALESIRGVLLFLLALALVGAVLALVALTRG